MVEQNKWIVPEFNRYCVVIDPFRIINMKTNRPLSFSLTKSGHSTAKLYYDKYKYRRISIVKIAAYAFHGYPPAQSLHYFFGDNYDDMNPSNVLWLDKTVVDTLIYASYDENQREAMKRLYYINGWTQREIANTYGIHQSTVSKAISHYHIR